MVSLPKEQRARVGRPPKSEGALSRAEITRRYKARQKERKLYMERVTIAAEALNAILKNANGQPLTIPLSVVADDPAKTLENIAMCVATQIARRDDERPQTEVIDQA